MGELKYVALRSIYDYSQSEFALLVDSSNNYPRDSPAVDRAFPRLGCRRPIPDSQSTRTREFLSPRREIRLRLGAR